MGEECPTPGNSTFHAMLSPVIPFHDVGTCCSNEVPSPRSPRQHGQFSADIEEAKQLQHAATRTIRAGRMKRIPTEGRIRQEQPAASYDETINALSTQHAGKGYTLPKSSSHSRPTHHKKRDSALRNPAANNVYRGRALAFCNCGLANAVNKTGNSYTLCFPTNGNSLILNKASLKIRASTSVAA
jgi:hypothetical protein